MCMDRIYFYGLLCLLFMFHEMINHTLGQPCSCSGYGGCNFSNKCVPENNCIKENVALGKPANMSSVWNSDVSACLAVNGNTSTSFYTGQDGKSNCVKSSATEHYPSWTVDLGQNYTITNITLYTEKSYTMVTRGLQVTVDGNLCFQFENDHNAQERENFMCTKPVNGRTVKFYSAWNYYIFFCEVQVWVCKAGLYGDDCDHVCHCMDNEACDNYYGTCTTASACSDGYYGQNCNLSCGNCFGGVCNKSNGSCPKGCEAGWMNTTCKDECHAGNYGPNCENTCGDCVNGSICNKTTGMCPYGCNNGWTTPYCNQTCVNGLYGQNCSGQCGNCTSGEPCDKVNGQCLSCDPGLKPPLCQQDCTIGTYGQNCSSLCGNCTNGEACDKVDGKCRSCAPGLEPPLCQLVSAASGNIVGPIVGAIVGGFIILGIILSLTIVIFLRRYKSKSADSINTTSNVLQPVSDTSASIQPSKKDESSTEYDEIGNPYDSLHPADDSENHNYASHATEERKSKSNEDNSFYVNVITKDKF